MLRSVTTNFDFYFFRIGRRWLTHCHQPLTENDFVNFVFVVIRGLEMWWLRCLARGNDIAGANEDCSISAVTIEPINALSWDCLGAALLRVKRKRAAVMRNFADIPM